MSYKYQIKKGFEGRVFAGAKNLGDGLVESDEPLNSIYLMPADKSAAPAPDAGGGSPSAPASSAETPAAPAQPTIPAGSPQTEVKTETKTEETK